MMKHRWKTASLPNTKFCVRCGLMELTPPYSEAFIRRRKRLWRWFHEQQSYLDMPGCPQGDPRLTPPETMKFVLANRRFTTDFKQE